MKAKTACVVFELIDIIENISSLSNSVVFVFARKSINDTVPIGLHLI